MTALIDYDDDPEAWRDLATCAQTDPEVFFPPKGGTMVVASAKQVCGECPVRAECLEYALKHGEIWGIWGGLTEWERRKLKRPRKKRLPQPCGTPAAAKRHYRNGEKPCPACSRAMALARDNR